MYLISFKSTHHAMMMEMKVKEKNLKALTIPTPRAISNSCGMSIKLDGGSRTGKACGDSGKRRPEDTWDIQGGRQYP